MREERRSVTAEQAFHLVRLSRYFSELSPQPMVAVEGTTHIMRACGPSGNLHSRLCESWLGCFNCNVGGVS